MRLPLNPQRPTMVLGRLHVGLAARARPHLLRRVHTGAAAGAGPAPVIKPFRAEGANWGKATPYGQGTAKKGSYSHIPLVGSPGHWANPYTRNVWMHLQQRATNTTEWDTAMQTGGGIFHDSNGVSIKQREVLPSPPSRRPHCLLQY